MKIALMLALCNNWLSSKPKLAFSNQQFWSFGLRAESGVEKQLTVEKTMNSVR